MSEGHNHFLRITYFKLVVGSCDKNENVAYSVLCIFLNMIVVVGLTVSEIHRV